MVQILDEVADIATSEPSLFLPLTLPQVPQDNAYELSNESILAIKNTLITLLNSDKGNHILTQAVSELVSKRSYELIALEDEHTPDELSKRLQSGECLMINPACRFVLQQNQWYINGEALCLDDDEKHLMARLTNHEVIVFDDLVGNLDYGLNDKRLTSMTAWFNDGWLCSSP